MLDGYPRAGAFPRSPGLQLWDGGVWKAGIHGSEHFLSGMAPLSLLARLWRLALITQCQI